MLLYCTNTQTMTKQPSTQLLSKLDLHFICKNFAGLFLQTVDLLISQTSLHATIRYTVAVTGSLLHINTTALAPKQAIATNTICWEISDYAKHQESIPHTSQHTAPKNINFHTVPTQHWSTE